MGTESNGKARLTRRRVLKAGATALGGGGAALLTGAAATQAQQAPAVLTGSQTGRTFRGLVRHSNTLDVQPMRLTVLADTAIRATDLAEVAAEDARRVALEAMQNKTSKAENATAEAELASAMAQLPAIRKLRHRA